MFRQQPFIANIKITKVEKPNSLVLVIEEQANSVVSLYDVSTYLHLFQSFYQKFLFLDELHFYNIKSPELLEKLYDWFLKRLTHPIKKVYLKNIDDETTHIILKHYSPVITYLTLDTLDEEAFEEAACHSYPQLVTLSLIDLHWQQENIDCCPNFEKNTENLIENIPSVVVDNLNSVALIYLANNMKHLIIKNLCAIKSDTSNNVIDDNTSLTFNAIEGNPTSSTLAPTENEMLTLDYSNTTDPIINQQTTTLSTTVPTIKKLSLQLPVDVQKFMSSILDYADFETLILYGTVSDQDNFLKQIKSDISGTCKELKLQQISAASAATINVSHRPHITVNTFEQTFEDFLQTLDPEEPKISATTVEKFPDAPMTSEDFVCFIDIRDPFRARTNTFYSPNDILERIKNFYTITNAHCIIQNIAHNNLEKLDYSHIDEELLKCIEIFYKQPTQNCLNPIRSNIASLRWGDASLYTKDQSTICGEKMLFILTTVYPKMFDLFHIQTDYREGQELVNNITKIRKILESLPKIYDTKKIEPTNKVLLDLLLILSDLSLYSQAHQFDYKNAAEKIIKRHRIKYAQQITMHCSETSILNKALWSCLYEVLPCFVHYIYNSYSTLNLLLSSPKVMISQPPATGAPSNASKNNKRVCYRFLDGPDTSKLFRRENVSRGTVPDNNQVQVRADPNDGCPVIGPSSSQVRGPGQGRL